jgi:hypothetical protein
MELLALAEHSTEYASEYGDQDRQYNDGWNCRNG